MIRSLVDDTSMPQCIIRDFNDITSIKDKCKGAVYPSWLIRGFRETILECELENFPIYGYPFTWVKGDKGDGYVEKHLDRVLVSHYQRAIFPLCS